MSIFLAQVNKGVLDMGSPTNEARWREFLKQNEGKYIRIEKQKSLRSLSQNSLYWIYLEVISRETGNESEDLHEFFKQKFLPRKMITIKGKKTAHQFEKIKSTTKLGKLDFGEYMDKICALTNVPIPNKEDAGYLPT